MPKFNTWNYFENVFFDFKINSFKPLPLCSECWFCCSLTRGSNAIIGIDRMFSDKFLNFPTVKVPGRNDHLRHNHFCGRQNIFLFRQRQKPNATGWESSYVLQYICLWRNKTEDGGLVGYAIAPSMCPRFNSAGERQWWKIHWIWAFEHTMIVLFVLFEPFHDKIFFNFTKKVINFRIWWSLPRCVLPGSNSGWCPSECCTVNISGICEKNWSYSFIIYFKNYNNLSADNRINDDILLFFRLSSISIFVI